jgi:hypothetical protein
MGGERMTLCVQLGSFKTVEEVQQLIIDNSPTDLNAVSAPLLSIPRQCTRSPSSLPMFVMLLE